MRKTALLAAMSATLTLGAGPALAQNVTTDPSGVVIPQGEPVAFTPLAHVEKVGTGPIPVVLIPALGCDWTVWQSFMDRNKDLYTCYAITLPGMAGTDSPPLPTSVAGTPWLNNAVDAIAQMIEERDIAKPVVMGHSFGGQLAVRFGCAHPELVSKVITVDGMLALPLQNAANRAEPGRVFHIEVNWLPPAKQATKEQWDESLDRMVSGWIKAGPEQDRIKAMVKKTSTAAIVQYMQEFYKTDLTDDVLEFKKPLLAIAAISGAYASGGVTAPELKLRWETQMAPAPEETLVYLENTRHFIPLEEPEKLDGIVKAFIGRDGGGGPSAK